MLIIIRLEERASQIKNINRISLIIEIREPIDEMIFQARKLSG